MKDWDKRQRQDYQSSQGLDSLYKLRDSMHTNIGNSAAQSAQLKPLPRSQKLIDLVTSGSTSSENNTGIPTQMKEGFEAKSGFSFDDVKVHYNSDKPAQLQALAYTQGNQVYVGPGQEEHLLHELGHVVQQKQGIVKPTTQVNGVPVNDDPKMEASADCCGVLGNLPPVQMMEGRRVVQMCGRMMTRRQEQDGGQHSTEYDIAKGYLYRQVHYGREQLYPFKFDQSPTAKICSRANCNNIADTWDHKKPLASVFNDSWPDSIYEQTRREQFFDKSNLQPMCGICNSSKGSNGVEYDQRYATACMVFKVLGEADDYCDILAEYGSEVVNSECVLQYIDQITQQRRSQ